MIYKVSWLPWRNGACTEIQGISVSSLKLSVKLKSKRTEGPVSLIMMAYKAPWWGSKEAAASDKSFAPSPILFSSLRLSWNKESSPPPPSDLQPPIKGPLVWPLTDILCSERRGRLEANKHQGVHPGMIDRVKIIFWNILEYSAPCSCCFYPSYPCHHLSSF